MPLVIIPLTKACLKNSRKALQQGQTYLGSCQTYIMELFSENS